MSASGASNQNIVLNSFVAIKSLTVADANPVTIDGTGGLALTGTNGAVGIAVNSGAGACAIRTNLYLNGSPLVQVDTTSGLSLTGTISSASNGLTKLGRGRLSITGVCAFSGPVSVNGGALRMNSSNIGNSINIGGNDSILSGTGEVGAVTVNAGGALAPGDAMGALRTGALTLNGSSALIINVDASTATASRVRSMGNVTLNGLVNLVLSVNGPLGPGNHTFTLVDNASLNPIQGTGRFVFNNVSLNEGARFQWNGRIWAITYQGNPGGNSVAIMEVSANATLSSLSLSAGTLAPAFTSSGTSYTVDVPNSITSLTVIPTPSDSNAAVQIIGGANLVVGANTVAVQVTAPDGVASVTYSITVTRAASSNADLSGLAISSGTLSPVFTSSGTSYTVDVLNSVTGVTLTPTLSDITSSVQVTGGSTLVAGPNAITIQVTAQDRVTVKTYTVVVTRAPSSDASLASLALSAGALNPAFSSSGTTYAVTVSSSNAAVSVIPALSDSTASVQVRVNGGAFSPIGSGLSSVPLALHTGTNTIDVSTTAQDGVTARLYRITVIRPLSSNADLASLVLSSGSLSPAFATNVTGYSAVVGAAVTGVTVSAVTSNTTARVSFSGTSGFVMGPNLVTITVTAQDNTKKVYSITVSRMPSTATLTHLWTNTGKLAPAFSMTGTSYRVDVLYGVSSISVTPSATDPLSRLQVRIGGGSYTSLINGAPSTPIPLSLGANTIEIKVTAQDTVTNTVYTIAVNRSQPVLTTGSATRLRQDGATLNGVAAPEGQSLRLFFRYGQSTAYTSGTLAAINPITNSTNAVSGTLRITVGSPQLTGLSPATAYHAQLFAINSADATELAGNDVTFTTLADGPDRTLERLCITGTAGSVPGIQNGIWTAFQNPAINTLGHAALVGSFRSSNDAGTGIFAEIGSNPLALLVRTSQPAPGAAGAVYTWFSDPAFNSHDSLAFMGTLGCAPGGGSAALALVNTGGIWFIESGTSAPRLVARMNGPAPLEAGTSPALFNIFSSLVLPDAGGPVFTAFLKGPGVTATNDEGIWAANTAGTLRLVIRKGDTNLIQGKRLTRLSVFPLSPPVQGQTRSFDPTTANLVFTAGFDDGSAGVFQLQSGLGDGPDAIREVILSGSGHAVPGVTGTNGSACTWTTSLLMNYTESPAINSGTHVALMAMFQGVGRVNGRNTGIFAETGTTPFRPVVLAGDLAPNVAPVIGATGTSTAQFYSFGAPAFNNNDQLAFLATVCKGDSRSDWITHFNNTIGIWSDAPDSLHAAGNLHLVARQEQTAPGTGGLIYSSFTNLVLPDVGGPIFTALLRSPGGWVALGEGLWAVDAVGNAELIVRVNSTSFVQGKTVRTFNVFDTRAHPYLRKSDGQNRSFDPGTGDLIFTVTFTDGNTAVYRLVHATGNQ